MIKKCFSLMYYTGVAQSFLGIKLLIKPYEKLNISFVCEIVIVYDKRLPLDSNRSFNRALSC